MDWQIIVALIIAVPVILLPVLVIWYLNMGGVFAALKEARVRRAVESKEKATVKAD